MRYFLDCEFNGFGGELISLALVAEEGPCAYYVLEPTSGAEDWRVSHGLDPWVADNVIPHLWDCDFVGPRIMWTPARAAADIASLFAEDRSGVPSIISDWPADIRYFCGLIEKPGGFMADIPRLTFHMVRVDAYPNDLGLTQHNAHSDALALRYKLIGKKP